MGERAGRIGLGWRRVRRARAWLVGACLVLAVGASAASAASAAVPAPVTFLSTGSVQSYVVPVGVSGVHVTAIGAPGGGRL